MFVFVFVCLCLLCVLCVLVLMCACVCVLCVGGRVCVNGIAIVIGNANTRVHSAMPIPWWCNHSKSTNASANTNTVACTDNGNSWTPEPLKALSAAAAAAASSGGCGNRTGDSSGAAGGGGSGGGGSGGGGGGGGGGGYAYVFPVEIDTGRRLEIR